LESSSGESSPALLSRLYGMSANDQEVIGAAIELHYASTILFDLEPNAAYAMAAAGNSTPLPEIRTVRSMPSWASPFAPNTATLFAPTASSGLQVAMNSPTLWPAAGSSCNER
jgi:hypothetical protein